MQQQHPEDMMEMVRTATAVAMCAIRIEDELNCVGSLHTDFFDEARLFDYARQAVQNAERAVDYANSYRWMDNQLYERNCAEAERTNMPTFPCDRCSLPSPARLCATCVPLADQKFSTGTKVRLVGKTLNLTRAGIPAGTTGVVIEDLNEVVAKENAALRLGSKTDDRPRYLALVRFEEHNKQSWLRYHELEVTP